MVRSPIRIRPDGFIPPQISPFALSHPGQQQLWHGYTERMPMTLAYTATNKQGFNLPIKKKLHCRKLMKSHSVNKTKYFLWPEQMTPILHSAPELRREDFWFQKKHQEFLHGKPCHWNSMRCKMEL